MSRARRLTLASLALLALIVPPSASAQYPFTPLPGPTDLADQEELQMVAKSGVTGFGAWVGPYTAQVTSYPGAPLISVYCVDFLNSITVGQVWTANVLNLTMDDMKYTRLGLVGEDTDALARYKKAAWLATQFATNQNTTSWQQLASAIWTTVIAGDDPAYTYYGQYGNWLAAANEAEASGYQGMNFNYWQVLTDVTAGDNGEVLPAYQPGAQEYLVYVTPEPETILMMISGLLVLFVVWRRGGIA